LVRLGRLACLTQLLFRTLKLKSWALKLKAQSLMVFLSPTIKTLSPGFPFLPERHQALTLMR
jgi:hypothetical protein